MGYGGTGRIRSRSRAKPARGGYKGKSGPTLKLNFADGGGTLHTDITFTRASTATRFDSAGVLQTAASGVARVDSHVYDGTNWINRGFLIEEARTNLCLQSEALGTTWTNPGANTTITDNAGTAPDGNTTAEDVLHGDNAETVQQTITVTDNTVVAISAFVKQGTTGSHDFVKMSWLDESDGDNGFEAWFDLSTGNVGTAQAQGTGSYTASSATMTDVSGGWFHIFAVGQIVSGQTDGRFEIINTTADNVDTAEATNSVFWWGLQVEESAFPSSYIATTTASVTRAADTATMHSFAADILNPDEGTFYTRAIRANINASSRIFYIETEGGASDKPKMQVHGLTSPAQLRAVLEPSSGDTGLVDLSTEVANTEHQLAFAYAENDFAGTLDGGTIVADSSVSITTGYDEFHIGQADGGSRWNGHIARITYWNRRLSNGRLQSLTTA